MRNKLIFLFLLLAATRAFSQQRPNILFIYADDLGYGDLSCYGATKIQTPNIDRLAKEGLRLTNGHSTASTCTPSRYSLISGQYAWRKNGTGILPGDAALIIDTAHTTLPSLLKQAGYATGFVGKWHLGLGNAVAKNWNGEIRPGPNEAGFDYAFFFPATADRVPTVFIENHRVIAADPADPIRVSYTEKVGDDPTGKEHPELLKMASTHGHDQTVVNEIGRIGYMSGGKKARWVDEELATTFLSKAKAFIEHNRQRPFFLYFALSDIHVPRMPATMFKTKSVMGYRGDAILQMDWTVGEILKALDDLGLSKNTLIVFTSDNGPVLDDGYADQAVERLNGHTPAGPYRGGKYSVFEGGTRVPFLLRWPGRIAAGASSNALVCQMDFGASMAALLHRRLKKDDLPDSFDLLDAFTGVSKQGRKTLVEQGETLALVEGHWKYIAPAEGAAKTDDTGIETGLNPQPQLYDLATDPGEKNNLAAVHPEIVQRLAAALRARPTRP